MQVGMPGMRGRFLVLRHVASQFLVFIIAGSYVEKAIGPRLAPGKGTNFSML